MDHLKTGILPLVERTPGLKGAELFRRFNGHFGGNTNDSSFYRALRTQVSQGFVFKASDGTHTLSEKGKEAVASIREQIQKIAFLYQHPRIETVEQREPEFSLQCTYPTIGPAFRWPGGKTRQLGRLLKEVPTVPAKYLVSPFIGGGALELKLLQRWELVGGTFSDLNPVLINAWHFLRCPGLWTPIDSSIFCGLNGLHFRFEGYDFFDILNHVETCFADDTSREESAELFDLARLSLNERKGSFRDSPVSCEERSAMALLFFVLQSTSFNGLWRENKKGGYNTPFGKLRPAFNQQNLRGVSRVLLRPELDFRTASFDVALFDLIYQIEAGIVKAEDTFVFLDPPYTKDEGGGFVEYNAQVWNGYHDRKLSVICGILNRMGVKILQTNFEGERWKSLYPESDGWKVLPYEEQHSMGRQKAPCAIIKNY